MPETIIRECATPDYTNTWEVEDEDDQRKICGLCEIEGVAQTQAPTAESEGFRSIEKRISMAMKVALRRMAQEDLRRGKPSNLHPPEGLNPTLNRDREEQNGPPGNSHPVQERPGRAPALQEKERQCQTPGAAPMVASEQRGNEEQKKTDVTDRKESFRKKLRRRWKYTLMGFLLGGTIASVYAFVGAPLAFRAGHDLHAWVYVGFSAFMTLGMAAGAFILAGREERDLAGT